MFKMTQIAPFLLSIMLLNTSQGEAAGQTSELPERKDISPEYKWQLDDIYANEEKWQDDFLKLQSLLGQISQYKGKLHESSQNLLQCLKLRDEIGIISGKLYGYARMHRDEDSANTHYQAMTGKTETQLAQAGAATAFIEPEILGMENETLEAFKKQEVGLAPYAFYFENLLRQKQHILSPAEEEILSLSGDVTGATENVFNMLAHADMKFPFITDEKGNKVQLSEGRYQTFIKSADRRVRKEAFTSLFGTYNKFRNTFAATLGGNIKKDAFYSKVRKYPSTLEANLETDNVPLEVYNNLIDTVNNNLSFLHRYIALKQKALKLDKIHMYDLYTPLISDVKIEIKYDEAKLMVKEALKPLGPEYLSILEKGYASRWIDVYENKGKQTGAYSWGTYGVHPFVLLNYNGKYDDASTLAHEMGHAIHSYYSHATQPYVNSSYTTFCAEVASTTNEILLLDYMLSHTTDKNKKIFLINQYLEAVRGTVYRQTMFAEFEKIVHSKVESGETLTADILDEIWHELNTKYYGPDICVDKEIDVEWARIPHFYSSFYVYQYATGYSAATALASQLQIEGDVAQKRYIEFLKSGGSDYSLNILKRAGVDMSSPEPIQITLNKFADRVTELEKLLNL